MNRQSLKRRLPLFALIAVTFVGVAFASTKIRDYIITNSQIIASSVDATTLKLNGAAPLGHTLIGNGTSYVDSGNGTAWTCNSFGCYYIYPDGTIAQRGSAAGCVGSGHDCNVAVTFPMSFTTTANLTVQVTEVGGGHNNFTASHDGPTISGFNVQYGAYTFNGGSGTTLPGTQTADWYATGR